ncbi:uncharacterized protein [Asterias amurensis]|uniref:uncharacterized protein n=1 Tax=Asterias amurensis TaxID=7602 RepID=UPI003AB33F98
MASRLKLTALLLPWFVVMILVCRTQQQGTIVIQPQDEKIIEGSTVVFTCEITTDGVEEIKWCRRDTETGGDSQVIKDGGRFNIAETTGKIAQNLTISESVLSDSAYYFCTYGNQSTMGRLDVLPSTWLPLCSQTLGTGKLSTGEFFELACTSTGHVNTSLVWLVGETPVDNYQVTVSKDQESMKVTSTYGSTIGTSEVIVYTCEATLEGLRENCTVSINDEAPLDVIPLDVIPYIVVGLMSLIALLLFFVVLLILFRHRQCRICQQAMQEPHTVLDAASLQTGSWVPPPPVAYDVEGSESSEDRVSEKDTQIHRLERGTNQPPDVVPVLELEVPEVGDQPSSSSEVVTETEPADSSEPVPKAEPGPTTEIKPKTKNLTLTKNIDKNIEKPEKIVEKKDVQFPAHKTRGTRRPRDKKVKHYKEPPVKAKMKEKEPIYAHVKKLNVPPKSAQGGATSADAASAPSTSAGATAVPPPEPPPRPSPDSESKDTSSTTTNSSDQTPGVNDLGRGNSKKKRVKHYRKKSEDVKRNSHPEDTVLNIPAATNSTSESPPAQPKSSPKVPADRVIYAELDFSKDVGPNII